MSDMPRRDIVVLGASAGGFEALVEFSKALPATLQAALFVVQHIPPGYKSVLPTMMNKYGALIAAHAVDREPIVPGRIFVAPSDHHLLLDDGVVRVTKGPKENRSRPAIDPLFRSAAYIYGSRVIGVVLSGALDDGTSGLWTVKMRGGLAVVQDPADAVHTSMPASALANVQVDYSVPIAALGELITHLTQEEAPPSPSLPAREQEKLEREIEIVEEANALENTIMSFGDLSPFTCPECHGVLTTLRDGRIVRYRCHTGHAFSAESLLSSSSEQIEARLWDAVRAIDETVLLLQQMGEDFRRAGNIEAAQRCLEKALEAHERSTPIREAANATELLSLGKLERGA